jgi:hypothetical protein
MSRPKDRKSDLTAKELRSRLDYDPITGIFRYKVVPECQHKIKVGDIAGYIREKRYLVIKIDGKAYYAHRLAWLYVYGAWPTNLIDHEDTNKLNNSLSNLRPANQSKNKANAPKPKNNTSGFKGVVKCKNRWKAQITYQQQVMYLGLFDTKEKAHAAYLEKARELHGEFAHA